MMNRRLGPIAILALLLHAPAARAAQEVEAGPAQDSIEELIQRLGDSSWEAREGAQEALLLRGGEAVEPLTRAALSSDPEIALRAKLILSRVNPLRVQVRIQRIELDASPRITESLEGELAEGGDLQLPPRLDSTSFSVRCRVVGDRQVDLTVEEVLNGTRSQLQAPAFPEGAVGFIKRGEEGIYRQIGFHVDRERHPFAIILRWWIAQSFPAPGRGEAVRSPMDLPSLIGDLLVQAGSGEIPSRLAALDLLMLLRSKDAEAVFRTALKEPRLQPAALIGLAGLGDQKSLDELEKMAGAPVPRSPRGAAPEARGKKGRAQGLDALGIQQPAVLLDGQSSESSWQNRAMLVLLEANRQAGFDSLARRISEIDSLATHSALAELADRLDKAAAPARDMLLEAVSSPEFLTQLLWDDPEIEHFYGVLLENAAVSAQPQFIHRLLIGLARTMGTDPWSTSGRHRIFARLWDRIARGGGDPAVLQEVLKDVLDRAGSPSRLNEIVSWLGLCFREQPLPEEEFNKVILLLRAAILKEEDRGPSATMASNSLSELARTLALTEPQLVALARLLAEAAQAPKQPYAQQFLREVERLTGIPATRPRPTPGAGAAGAPVAGPAESILTLVDRWAAQPGEPAAALARLYPPVAASTGEPLEYWEFDLLTSDPPREGPVGAGALPAAVPAQRQVEVLDGHRLAAQVGVPIKFTDRWGNRISSRLEAESVAGANRYRINGQISLELGLPAFITGRDKELVIRRYETSDIRLGTTYLSMPRGQRLLRLACVRPAGRPPAADSEKSPSPAELWQEFLGGFLADLSSRSFERSFQIVRELNLREAVPALTKELQREDLKTAPRWDFAYNVARWLLERGDPAGREYLHGELGSTDARRRAQAAQILAAAGDPAGFGALLKVLRERPKEMNPYAAISGIDSYLRDKSLTSEECREALDLVIKNLHEPLFQAAGFTLISRFAGNDFGFQVASRQGGTAQVRQQAIGRSVEAARSWWASRSAPPPADGKDPGK